MTVLSVVVAVITCIVGSYVLLAQPETRPVILRCYHHGVTVATAPNVESFQLKQTGRFIEARWTDPDTSENEVLVTTLPCLYRVTQPRSDARPAD